jgi:dTDP-glucose 4,6-dehydratase
MAIAETDCRVVNFDKLTYAGNLENLTPVEGNPRHRFRARRYLRCRRGGCRF